MNDFGERERKLHSAKLLIGKTIQTALRCHVEPKFIFYKLIEAGYLNTCEFKGKKHSHLPLSPEVINKQFQLNEVNVDDLATVELGKHFITVLKRTISYLGGRGLTGDEIFTSFFSSAMDYWNTITDSPSEQMAMIRDSLDLISSNEASQ